MTTTEKALAGGAVALAIGSAVLIQDALQAPPPAPSWPFLKAEWSPVQCHGYNVYHGTNLDRRTWRKLGSTTETFYWFQSEQFGFVGVKAFNRSGTNELESDWGTAAQATP